MSFPRIIAAAGILLALLGFIALLESRLIRLSVLKNSAHCYARLAATMPDKVDVLLIGSSRIRRGIVPEDLKSYLSGDGKSVVVNFGHPGRDYQLDYALLDMLTEHSKVDLVLVEGDIGEARRNRLRKNKKIGRRFRASVGEYSEAFIVAASTGRLFETLNTEPETSTLLSLHQKLRFYLAKIDRVTKLMIAGRVGETLFGAPRDRIIDRAGICWKGNWDKGMNKNFAAEVMKKRERARSNFLKEHSWHDDGYAQSSILRSNSRKKDRIFLRKMIDLAHSRGTKIGFLYLPRYYVLPPAPEWADEFEERVGAPVLYPAKDFLASLQADGYIDHSHLSLTGRKRMTKWLADSLKKRGLVAP